MALSLSLSLPPEGGTRVGIPVEEVRDSKVPHVALRPAPLNPRHRPRTRGPALTDGQSQRVGVGPGSRAPNPAVAVPTAGRPTALRGPTPVATHTHTAPGAGSSLGADGCRTSGREWGK